MQGVLIIYPWKYACKHLTHLNNVIIITTYIHVYLVRKTVIYVIYCKDFDIN